MPVFEAKQLDSDFEGMALLASILHPTKQAQARALRHGSERAARAAALADPMTMGPRLPGATDDFAPARLPSN